MSTLLHLAPGTIFARDYRVLRPLAEGGMGAVYVVEQLSTSEQRALKIMHRDLAADEKSRARFDQEARLGARIQSAHLVKVIQAGVDEETQTPWLCMELLAGEDLASALARRKTLPLAELATLFAQLCHALELLHRVPIVHRDLKPENLFLSQPQGPGVPFTLKILDLGIAKLVQESRAATAKTASLGTPLWMAPEQADPEATITPATDVWALGLIAFRALTGRCYWKAANVENASVTHVYAEVLTGALPAASARAAELGVAPSVVMHGFDEWLARCVARDPKARFADAGAACAALLPLLGVTPDRTALGLGDTVPFPSPPARAATPEPTTTTSAAIAPPPATPRPRARTGLAVGAVAVVVITGALVLRSTRVASSTAPRSPVAAAPAAASLRAIAAVESLGKERSACLADLERADAIDPAGAAAVAPDVRARCEMAAGHCDEGRRRYRTFLESDPRVPSISIEGMLRTVVSQTCPFAQLDEGERVTALAGEVNDAWSRGDADTCHAKGNALALLIPTLGHRTGSDDLTMNTALGALQTCATCVAKAGRCDEGRALYRRYYRLAPYLAQMKEAYADAAFAALNPGCAGH